MKELNIHEIQQIAGGVDPLVLGIGGLAVINLMYNISQSSQIDALTEVALASSVLSLYHEAQLALLPHYDKVSNYSLVDIFA